MSFLPFVSFIGLCAALKGLDELEGEEEEDEESSGDEKKTDEKSVSSKTKKEKEKEKSAGNFLKRIELSVSTLFSSPNTSGANKTFSKGSRAKSSGGASASFRDHGTVPKLYGDDEVKSAPSTIRSTLRSLTAMLSRQNTKESVGNGRTSSERMLQGSQTPVGGSPLPAVSVFLGFFSPKIHLFSRREARTSSLQIHRERVALLPQGRLVCVRVHLHLRHPTLPTPGQDSHGL